MNTASRLQSVAPAGARPRRRGDPARHERRHRVRGGGRAAAQGQGRARAGVAGRPDHRRAARPRPRRPPRGAVRRPRHGAAPAQGPVPRDVARASGPARVHHRPGRHRQEPAGLGVPEVPRRPRRADLLARGPIPVVRRGDHVLVAGRDGPLARPPARDGRSGRRRARASARCSRSTCPTRRSGGGSSRRCSRCSGRATPRPAAPAELFSAWRTFFERVAANGVVVLLFEDLQWADPGTLDFIEHVLEWTRNVPILIVTLARPELLEQRPGLGRRQAGVPRARPPAARRRVDARAPRRARRRPARGGRALDRRARRGDPAVRGGDHPHARRRRPARASARAASGTSRSGELGELAVPDTLHALIAARLDGLDTADRALVQDAAMLGQSFTIGAARGGRQPRSGRGDAAARPPRPGRPAPARGRPAVARARPVRVRPGAHPGGRLLDAVAARPAQRATSRPRATSSRSATTSSPARSPPTTSPPTGRRPRAPRRRRSVAQARIALRAAAERAIALGAPGQAVDVPRPGDRGDRRRAPIGPSCTSGRGRRPRMRPRRRSRSATSRRRERLYEELGDRPSQARMVARRRQRARPAPAPRRGDGAPGSRLASSSRTSATTTPT